MKSWVRLFEAGMRGGDAEVTPTTIEAWAVDIAGMNVLEEDLKRPECGRIRGRVRDVQVRSIGLADGATSPDAILVEVEWFLGRLPSQNWIVGSFINNPVDHQTGERMSRVVVRSLYLTDHPIHSHLGRIRPPNEPAVAANERVAIDGEGHDFNGSRATRTTPEAFTPGLRELAAFVGPEFGRDAAFTGLLQP